MCGSHSDATHHGPVCWSSSQMFPGTGSCESCEKANSHCVRSGFIPGLTSSSSASKCPFLISLPVVLGVCVCAMDTLVLCHDALTEKDKSQQAFHSNLQSIPGTRRMAAQIRLCTPCINASVFIFFSFASIMLWLQLSHWGRSSRPSAGCSLCPLHTLLFFTSTGRSNLISCFMSMNAGSFSSTHVVVYAHGNADIIIL